jgi:hypothetical protein
MEDLAARHGIGPMPAPTHQAATDLGTTGDTALTPWWGPGNNNSGYFAWVMELGNVADDPAATDHFELAAQAPDGHLTAPQALQAPQAL